MSMYTEPLVISKVEMILIVITLVSHYSWNIQEGNAPSSQVAAFKKGVYATILMYNPCALFVKTSILLLLARVFAPRRQMVRFIRVFISLLALYYIPVSILKAIICRPVRLLSGLNPEYQACFRQRALILADAIVSVISDLGLLIMPLPLVHSLHIPFKQKLRVAAVLAAGGIAGILSIAKLIDILWDRESGDLLWTFARINLWGCVLDNTCCRLRSTQTSLASYSAPTPLC